VRTATQRDSGSAEILKFVADRFIAIVEKHRNPLQQYDEVITAESVTSSHSQECCSASPAISHQGRGWRSAERHGLSWRGCLDMEIAHAAVKNMEIQS
jgi:hypothetical protein